ncbi:hypothetical protein D9M69_669990 [compost metagenome]
MEIVDGEARQQGRQGDPGRDQRGGVAQVFADHEFGQGAGHQRHADSSGQADQDEGRDLFAGGGGQLLAPAALQRHDEGGRAGGAKPDEQDIERAVRDAVASVIGADRRFVHEEGQQKAVGRS